MMERLCALVLGTHCSRSGLNSAGVGVRRLLLLLSLVPKLGWRLNRTDDAAADLYNIYDTANKITDQPWVVSWLMLYDTHNPAHFQTSPLLWPSFLSITPAICCWRRAHGPSTFSYFCRPCCRWGYSSLFCSDSWWRVKPQTFLPGRFLHWLINCLAF